MEDWGVSCHGAADVARQFSWINPHTRMAFPDYACQSLRFTTECARHPTMGGTRARACGMERVAGLTAK